MKVINVAAGVIFNEDGKVLICQRTGTLDGLWEFPGGKLEACENVFQCLRRELGEELELSVETKEEICTVEQQTQERNLVLHFIRAKALNGQQIKLHVHHSALWIEPEQAGQYEFCPADAEFLRKNLL